MCWHIGKRASGVVEANSFSERHLRVASKRFLKTSECVEVKTESRLISSGAIGPTAGDGGSRSVPPSSLGPLGEHEIRSGYCQSNVVRRGVQVEHNTAFTVYL